jgi:hypothetical protein
VSAAPAGALVAAALTPTTAGGRRDEAVTRAYIESLVADGADGLAVAVHTGRGRGECRGHQRAGGRGVGECGDGRLHPAIMPSARRLRSPRPDACPTCA